MPIFEFVASNTLATIISLVTGYSLAHILSWIRLNFFIRPLYHSLMPIKKGSQINCIIPTLNDEEFSKKEFIKFTTPLESVASVQYINGVFEKLNIPLSRLNVIFSRSASQKEIEEDIILLGGPNHNGWSREFMKTNICGLNFNGYRLVSKYSGNEYEASITEGRVTTDYISFVSKQNPWGVNSQVLLVAGCRGFGSIGVLKMAEAGTLLKVLAKHEAYEKNKGVEAVFSIDINHVGDHAFSFSNLQCHEATFSDRDK